MAKVIYDGPDPEREIPLPSGRSVTVKAGESVDVDEKTAKSLCEQEYFSRGKSKSASTPQKEK